MHELGRAIPRNNLRRPFYVPSRVVFRPFDLPEVKPSLRLSTLSFSSSAGTSAPAPALRPPSAVPLFLPTPFLPFIRLPRHPVHFCFLPFFLASTVSLSALFPTAFIFRRPLSCAYASALPGARRAPEGVLRRRGIIEGGGSSRSSGLRRAKRCAARVIAPRENGSWPSSARCSRRCCLLDVPVVRLSLLGLRVC